MVAAGLCDYSVTVDYYGVDGYSVSGCGGACSGEC